MHHTSTRRVRYLAGSALVVSLIAGACGSSSELTQVVEQADGDPVPRLDTPGLPQPGSGSADPVAEARRDPRAFVLGSSAKTVTEGSVTIELTLALTGLPEVGEVSLVVEAAQEPGGDSWLRMDFGDFLAAAAELGGGELGPFAGMFAEPIEVRVVGDTTYMSSSFLGFLVPVDTPWVALPTDAPDDTSDFSMETFDPAEFLDILRGVGADAEVVGAETVDGVDTVHVRGSLSLAEALRLATPEERRQLEESFSSLDPLGVMGGLDEVAFDVDLWIDAEDRVRRLVLAVEDLSRFAAAEGMPPGVGLRIELHLSDFGVPVVVEAPPPDEVTPIEELDPFGLGG